MEIPGELDELGLSDSESKLYMELLREGEGTASSLAKRSGVNRRLAYDKIQELVDRGLVSYRDEEDRRVYKASDPERLRELVRERKQDLEELERQVEDLVPELLAQYNENSGDREVKVFQGKQGIKQLFNDELRKAEDTIYLIGSPQESEELLEYFLPSWTRRRREKDIMIKGIFEERMRGEVGEHGPIEDRYLPEDYDSKVSISIYGDNVGIIFWIVNPLVILIEDEDAADSFLNYFDLVWESARE